MGCVKLGRNFFFGIERFRVCYIPGSSLMATHGKTNVERTKNITCLGSASFCRQHRRMGDQTNTLGFRLWDGEYQYFCFTLKQTPTNRRLRGSIKLRGNNRRQLHVATILLEKRHTKWSFNTRYKIKQKRSQSRPISKTERKNRKQMKNEDKFTNMKTNKNKGEER